MKGGAMGGAMGRVRNWRSGSTKVERAVVVVPAAPLLTYWLTHSVLRRTVTVEVGKVDEVIHGGVAHVVDVELQHQALDLGPG